LPRATLESQSQNLNPGPDSTVSALPLAQLSTCTACMRLSPSCCEWLIAPNEGPPHLQQVSLWTLMSLSLCDLGCPCQIFVLGPTSEHNLRVS
jgi:hypothetical protein